MQPQEVLTPSLRSSAFGISKRPRSQSATYRSDVSCGTTADSARVSVQLCTNIPPPTSSDDNSKINQLALTHLETALPLTRQGLPITRVIFHNVQVAHDGAIPTPTLLQYGVEKIPITNRQQTGRLETALAKPTKTALSGGNRPSSGTSSHRPSSRLRAAVMFCTSIGAARGRTAPASYASSKALKMSSSWSRSTTWIRPPAKAGSSLVGMGAQKEIP